MKRKPRWRGTQSARMAAVKRNAAKANGDLAAPTFQRFQKLFDSKSVSPRNLMRQGHAAMPALRIWPQKRRWSPRRRTG